MEGVAACAMMVGVEDMGAETASENADDDGDGAGDGGAIAGCAHTLRCACLAAE